MILDALKGDHYQTIKAPQEGVFKDRGSKFIGICYPMQDDSDFSGILETVKKKYYDARHHCYAYRCQPTAPQGRFNDDGEPSHSAGTPIYNAIQSQEVWDLAVIVVRYFGGTKLGVGGLINAYKTAAIEALQKAERLDVYLYRHFEMRFPYAAMDDVMRVLPQSDFEIVNETMANDAGYLLKVRKSLGNKALEQLTDLYQIKIKEINNDD
jgi:uncharacterized YigZ family protein